MAIETRFIYKNGKLSDEGALKIVNGGTSSRTAKTARLKLDMLGYEDLDVANGAITVDSTGKIRATSLPPSFSDPSLPTLYGPEAVETGTTATFYITNYDSEVEYTTSGVGGAVTRSVDVVKFSADSIPGTTSAIVVNSRRFPITIIATHISPPVIIAPLTGSNVAFKDLVIVTDAFTCSDPAIVHISSDWELSTDASFSTIMESVSSDTNLTNWTPKNMKEFTTLYARVRFHSDKGLTSDWSDPVSFTTGGDGQISTDYQRLVASVYNATGRFGNGLAASDDGTYVLAGSPGDSVTKNNSGAVYAFTRVNGIYQQKQVIKAPVVNASEGFGVSCAMSPDGTLAAICSYGWDGGPVMLGSLYIYARSGDTWTFVQKITPTDTASSDVYGSFVVISRDKSTIAVSAPYQNMGRGAVYVYTLVGGVWTQQSILYAWTWDNWQDMGWQALSISADGNTLAAGALGADSTSGLLDTGCVYIFSRTGSTWSQQAQVFPTDSFTGQNFGMQCFLSDDGNRLVSSMYSGNGQSGNTSAVYVFTRSGSTWTQQAKITDASTLSSEFFGYRIHYTANKLLITKMKQTPYLNTGEVFVYDLIAGSFTLANKLTPPTPYNNMYFGWRLHSFYDNKAALIGYNTVNSGDAAGSLAYYV